MLKQAKLKQQKTFTAVPRLSAPAVFCALVAAGVCVAALPGCTIGGKGSVRKHNLALREENAHLKTEVDQMQTRVEGLLKQLDAADQTTESPLRGSQRLVVTETNLSRYTTPLDRNKDGKDDVVKIELTTHDQDGHIFAAKGNVWLQLVALDAEDQEIGLLAETRFDAPEVQKAYRQGFLGSAYVFSMDLPADLAKPEGTAFVEVRSSFEDAFTGASFVAKRKVSMQW